GCAAASCADDVAFPNATTAAIASPMSSPAPAAAAAGANTAKTPAPIIEPSPMKTASPRFSRRARALSATSPTIAPSGERVVTSTGQRRRPFGHAGGALGLGEVFDARHDRPAHAERV